MGLSLNLLVSQSAAWATCDVTSVNESDPYSITPMVDHTAVNFSSNPTNSQEGKVTGLQGLVASADTSANSLTVTAIDGPVWTIVTNGNTVYQGIAGFSALTVGMPVSMDAAFQPNGSLVASRVSVADTDTMDLSVAIGPVEFVSVAYPDLFAVEDEERGYLPGAFGSVPFSFGTPFSTSQASSRTCRASPSQPISARRTSSPDRSSPSLPTRRPLPRSRSSCPRLRSRCFHRRSTERSAPSAAKAVSQPIR